MEHKMPGRENVATPEFYKNMPLGAYSEARNDSLRLYLINGLAAWLAKFENIRTIGDFGCGNGALIEMMKHNIPQARVFGYDLIPQNIKYAQNRGLEVILKDITQGDIEYPNLITMVEILEHLDNPRDFISKIPPERFIIATAPSRETEKQADPLHCWVWTDDSFYRMFEECRFDILEKGVIQKIFIVVARKK